MEILISSLLAISAGLLAIPVIVLFVEVLAAVTLPFRNHADPESNASRNRLAVLVPAHDEGTALLRTIADIRSQLRPGDRLLVVADNCTDDTADIALAAGAEVVERHDPAKRGKGYALDFGVRHLNSDPPEIVIIIDADCELGDHALDRLVVACARTRRPMQALFLMTAPEATSLNYQIAEFAWRVRNWVRPLGLCTLGLPCQLMGTGMAFPWDLIRSADLASGQIVEDLKFGLEFAMAGTAPLFCPSAVVMSTFPSSIKGSQHQRKRWEQGHINMILKSAPRFFSRAVADGNWALLVLTLDLAVPPLSLLGILIVGMFAVAATAMITGFSSAALAISTASLLAYIAAVFLARIKCGRDVLPARAILSIAPYAFKKLILYWQVVSGTADPKWIRTDRSKLDGSK